MIAQDQPSTLTKYTHETLPLISDRPKPSSDASSGASPRIALLTPYTGGNLGDAAIQDAMIANLRLRLPNAQFSGISLNSENYLRRHGTMAFPLCASGDTFYGMSGELDASTQEAAEQTAAPSVRRYPLRTVLRRVPGARWFLKTLKPRLSLLQNEIRHCVDGRRFLCSHDLLIVCGGGQLDEEWGGPWGHPFALFKWAALSKFAGIPFIVASVGACKTSSKASRFFLSSALRMACYRSYRDKNSHAIAAGLLSRAAKDPVVPDVAFSLPSSEFPQPADLRAMAQGRTIVAISPIVYGKPGLWPSAEGDLYNRYLDQLAEAVSQLLKSNNFLVFVWSARGDEPVIPELLARIDGDSKKLLALQAYLPKLTSWMDLLAVLQAADFLVASRLHSTIFGFLAQTPLVAISFDSKIDWVMQDLSQLDSLLQIRNFTANDVMEALARLELRRNEKNQQFTAYRHQILHISDKQFDALAESVLASARRPI